MLMLLLSTLKYNIIYVECVKLSQGIKFQEKISHEETYHPENCFSKFFKPVLPQLILDENSYNKIFFMLINIFY